MKRDYKGIRLQLPTTTLAQLRGLAETHETSIAALVRACIKLAIAELERSLADGTAFEGEATLRDRVPLIVEIMPNRDSDVHHPKPERPRRKRARVHLGDPEPLDLITMDKLEVFARANNLSLPWLIEKSVKEKTHGELTPATPLNVTVTTPAQDAKADVSVVHRPAHASRLESSSQDVSPPSDTKGKHSP